MWSATSKVWSKNVQSPHFNPHSRMESDYEYADTLEFITYFNPHSRTESDWDVFAGQYFSEFISIHTLARRVTMKSIPPRIRSRTFQSTLSHGE